MASKTYDVRELSVIVATSPINGFDVESALSIEIEEAQFGHNVDINNKFSRYRKNNSVAKITFTLTQASDSNQLLNNFLIADALKNAGMFNLMIKDNTSGSIFTCAEAYVEKAPTTDYGTENKNRVWTIICSNYQHNIIGFN